MREPGPDHPIHVEPVRGTGAGSASPSMSLVDTAPRAAAGGSGLSAGLLRPARDAHMDMARAERPRHPLSVQGRCELFQHLVDGDRRERDAVWSYEASYLGCWPRIAGYLAFYPDRGGIRDSVPFG